VTVLRSNADGGGYIPGNASALPTRTIGGGHVMGALMTILEANVPGEYWPDLQSGWQEMSRDQPEQLVQSWLIQGTDGRDTWCAVAIWRSKEAFEAYRASVDAPAAVKLFRSFNAEPVLAAFEVVA
jgi:hypothetical protein